LFFCVGVFGFSFFLWGVGPTHIVFFVLFGKEKEKKKFNNQHLLRF